MDKELQGIIIKLIILIFLVIPLVLIFVIYLPTFLDQLIFGNVVYGQTSTTAPPSSTLPTPNLQYLPQKAYIVPLNPDGISSQAPSGSLNLGGFDTNSIVSSAVTSAAAYFLAKRRADSNKTDLEEKRKEDLLDILKTKQQTQELAKYTFSIDPEKAEKLENADKIKLCNLEADVNKTAEKAAKS